MVEYLLYFRAVMAESSDEQRGKIEDFDDVDVLNMQI
jgi:hypothetical protein